MLLVWVLIVERAKSSILPTGNFREFFLWRGGILRFQNGNSRWPWSRTCGRCGVRLVSFRFRGTVAKLGEKRQLGYFGSGLRGKIWIWCPRFWATFHRAALNAERSIVASICPSVRPSDACIVTKRERNMYRFLYLTTDHLPSFLRKRMVGGGPGHDPFYLRRRTVHGWGRPGGGWQISASLVANGPPPARRWSRAVYGGPWPWASTVLVRYYRCPFGWSSGCRRAGWRGEIRGEGVVLPYYIL